MTVRARSTPNPSPTRSIINFCKCGRRVLFVLKPSRPHSSGLGGLTGTDPGLATPRYQPHDSIDDPAAPALLHLYVIIFVIRSTINRASSSRMWVSAP